MVAKGATRLACDGQRYTVDIDGGPRIRARAVIIATGAEYRKPALDNLSAFEGAGVYYGATPMEAQLCVGEDVVVVGGGNSAGQAAVFLASTARRVHMLVRGPGLADTMSRYLIRRIEENPAIVLRTRTEIVALEGNGQLERVRWRDDQTGEVETHDIRHVFMMTGAVPEHAHGWTAASRSTTRASSRPDRTSRRTSSRPRSGRSRGRRICSKPAGPRSLPLATCAAATSSAWRRRSAKDRSRSRFVHRCCGNNRRLTT